MSAKETKAQAQLMRALIEEYTENRAAGDWIAVKPGNPLPQPFQRVIVQYTVEEKDTVKVEMSTDWVNFDGKFNMDNTDCKVTHWAEIIPAKEVRA